MTISSMKLYFRKHISEKEMVEGCQRGDSSCQSLLYHRTCNKMLGICLRYIKDKEKAEDVLQEGYLKLFKNISTYRQEGSLDGWASRVMVSACLEELRKSSLEPWKESIYENNIDYSENLIIEKISAQELLEIIHSLSDGYRAVFNLYAIEGFSHKEISEMLGITENTSKSQLSRARAMLRAKIEKQNFEILSYAN